MIWIGGNEPQQMLGFEPDAFVSHRTPEEDQRPAVDLPTGMRQLIKLARSAKVHVAHGVLRHLAPLLCFNIALDRFR